MNYISKIKIGNISYNINDSSIPQISPLDTEKLLVVNSTNNGFTLSDMKISEAATITYVTSKIGN